MASSRSGLYDDPSVYDVLHAPGTAEEIDGLEAIEARFAPASGRRLWLEPACGSGRYLRLAARRGIDCVGFDLSPAMIDYAAVHAPQPGDGAGQSTYFVADMTDFVAGLGRRRATFAFNLINTLRHLPSDAAVLAHLEQMSRALARGGVYIVGLSLAAYGRERPHEDVWSGSRGRVRVTQVVQYLPPRWEGNPSTRWEQVVSHLVVERPTGREHRDSTYRLRAYDLRQWRDLVSHSALSIEAEVDEVGEPFPAADGGYHLFVLRGP